VKHQYFGDVNDYLTYGVLRAFVAAGLRLGVLWMLTPPDGRRDGGKTGYLDRPDLWRRHDPELFDILAAALARPGGRHLRHAETGAMLPSARFSGQIVPDRREPRRRWLERALADLAGCDLVFLDPDNGIEVASVPRGRKNSSKYVFWDEIAETWSRGQSLLVFQHFARERREDHARRLAAGLAGSTPEAAVTRLTTSHVLFLVAAREGHRRQVERACASIARSWSGRIGIAGAGAGSSVRLPSGGQRSREVRKRPDGRSPS
jgi:hypothetical protein